MSRGCGGSSLDPSSSYKGALIARREVARKKKMRVAVVCLWGEQEVISARPEGEGDGDKVVVYKRRDSL